jgi:hypothetical protein
MIQATGQIPCSNGIANFSNPVINVYLNTPNKYSPTIAVAQVGKILNRGEDNESFEIVEEICTSKYEIKNPSFEAVQNLLLTDLQAKYPTVTFEVI